MSQSASSDANISTDQPPHKQPWLLVLIFRLLLLGVSGGMALIIGIFLGVLYPDPNPAKPLLLILLESFTQTEEQSSPTLDSVNPSPPLTPAQQQQAQLQLAQLQAQLQALEEAVSALENQLNTLTPPSPNQTLEARLQAIALYLQPPTAPTPSTSGTQKTDKLKVTLPSDVLFEQGNSALVAEASVILDKIVADLRNYPGNTIRISAHTDAALDAQQNQELSFERASAIKQYLERTLDDDRYRWLVIGYGNTRPLAVNDSGANQLRNRRIEIAVD